MRCVALMLLLWSFALCHVAVAEDPEATTQPAGAANWAEARVYKKTPKTELSLYVVQPDARKFPGARPSIVFFHGGGWNNGNPRQFAGQCRELAKRGMVAISVQYRLHSKDGAMLADCVSDAFSAVRYVREHAAELKIDPQRLAVGGGSAGGHLAAATATLDPAQFLPEGEKPPADLSVYRPSVLVLFNPVYDTNPDGGYYVLRIVGKDWKRLSPADNLNAAMPPTLVMLGDQDKLIPVATAERVRDRMKELGVRSDLKIYPGQPHGFFNGAGRDETTKDMVEFLRSLGYVQ